MATNKLIIKEIEIKPFGDEKPEDGKKFLLRVEIYYHKDGIGRYERCYAVHYTPIWETTSPGYSVMGWSSAIPGTYHHLDNASRFNKKVFEGLGEYYKRIIDADIEQVLKDYNLERYE